MANGGDSWGIFSNPWVSLSLSPHTSSLKILRNSSGKRIRTVLWGEAGRWGSGERGRRPASKAGIVVCYRDVAVWGLDCLGLERPILKELKLQPFKLHPIYSFLKVPAEFRCVLEASQETLREESIVFRNQKTECPCPEPHSVMERAEARSKGEGVRASSLLFSSSLETLPPPFLSGKRCPCGPAELINIWMFPLFPAPVKSLILWVSLVPTLLKWKWEVSLN